MKEHPMIFSGPMVRAIIEGRKTQTRRIVKLPKWAIPGVVRPQPNGGIVVLRRETGADEDISSRIHPGDAIWVREAWVIGDGMNPDGDTAKPTYRADWPDVDGVKWKSPIHMPRWASRLSLPVKSVRVERLHDISKEDARAEGAEGGCVWCGVPNGTCDCENPRPDYRDGFVNIWNTIYGPESWWSNPWVWVYEFERTVTK